jgi:hypothetical protein
MPDGIRWGRSGRARARVDTRDLCPGDGRADDEAGSRPSARAAAVAATRLVLLNRDTVVHRCCIAWTEEQSIDRSARHPLFVVLCGRVESRPPDFSDNLNEGTGRQIGRWDVFAAVFPSVSRWPSATGLWYGQRDQRALISSARKPAPPDPQRVFPAARTPGSPRRSANGSWPAAAAGDR